MASSQANNPTTDCKTPDYFVIDAPPVYYWSCNVHALDVSPNGRWLAMGCGGWCGCGVLAIVDLKTNQRVFTYRFAEAFPKESEEVDLKDETPLPPPLKTAEALTISGVAFDASGKFLAACSWFCRQRPGPVYLFKVMIHASSVSLQHCHTFYIDRNIPTGVCFGHEKLYVRYHRASCIDQIICSFKIPALESLKGIDTNVHHPYRSHAGIAVVNHHHDNNNVMENHQIVTGQSRGGKDGLVVGVTPKTDGGMSHIFCGVPKKTANVTALVILPSHEMVTGDVSGSILFWPHTPRENNTKWRSCCLIRGNTNHEPRVNDVNWVEFCPSSIVALCALNDGRFFSADGSGEVLEWHRPNSRSGSADWRILRRRLIPLPGTPRSMTVHPSTAASHKALLMVGLKVGESAEREYGHGCVVCFEIENGWYHVGSFILLRKLVEEGRAAKKKVVSKDSVVGETHFAIEWLVVDLDAALFRVVLSFLIPG